MWARAVPPRRGELLDHGVVDGAQLARASPSPAASGIGPGVGSPGVEPAPPEIGERGGRWSAPPSASTALVIRSRSQAARSVGPAVAAHSSAWPGGSARPSKWTRGLGRIVDPQARGRGLLAQREAAPRTRRRRPTAAGTRRRGAPRASMWMRSTARGDEADRALAAAQRAREVGAGRAARRDAGVHACGRRRAPRTPRRRRPRRSRAARSTCPGVRTAMMPPSDEVSTTGG